MLQKSPLFPDDVLCSETETQKPAREWLKVLARYRTPSTARSITEIVITGAPFALLWVAAWWSLGISYWLTGAFIVPAAFLLVRLFLIQHDCGHQAFFHKRVTNDWTGRVLGVFTATPYDVWRKQHAAHHSGSGNLACRDLGEIETLTVREYKALPWWMKLRYRLYRAPAVLFGLGPAYVFLLKNRLPYGFMRGNGWGPWISAMGTNAAIAMIVVLMMWLVGPVPFLVVHIPILLLAATIGVWLFYVQHQFEDTIWEQDKDWDMQEAALYGSSYYVMPKPLQWVTANIGVHHVHHLYARIPFYRLPQVLRDHPELAGIQRITIPESFKCVRLQLWCEAHRKLVSFKEARRLARMQSIPSGQVTDDHNGT
ncbi:MAG: fatty acid desaturase [Hyphomicrobiaceae bacterium]